jgi:type I restriction enzyme M protein
MLTLYKSEREVEAKLLHPLFRDVLGYPEDELDWAVPVQMSFGREKKTKEADLVAKFKGRNVITIEAKKPTEPVQAYIGQLDSYAFHLQTPYSIITNGRQFILRGYYSFNSRINVIDESVDGLVSDRWKKLHSLISFKNIQSTLAEPSHPVTVPDEGKIRDFRRFFRRIHNTIRDRDKLDPGAAFDELSKLLFLKAAEDEWLSRNRAKPVLTPEKIEEWEALGKETAQSLVNKWFAAATDELFPGVFGDQPQINLSPATLAIVLQDMSTFHVKGGDVDVKGRAFEEFLPSQLRGEGLGQFFTPRPIVNFMVELASISIHDVVADFACGSGGFLIKAFEQMERGVEQLPDGTLRRMGTTRTELLEDIKVNQIYGIDAEPRAARTAKMNMLMWGDGKKVVRGNSLDDKDHSGKPYELSEYSAQNQGSGCTVILANPPFGSREKDGRILRRYSLGGEAQDKKSEKTEVLFIEKGLKLLRPEGKMLIVLPQGLMSGVNNARVRDYIHSQAEVRAVISLPTHAFVQSGVPTVNTCVLFVQKFTEEKKALYDERTRGLSQAEIRRLLRSDPEFEYSIFMGTAEFVGFEPSGRSIVEKGEKTDLDLLLEDFMNRDALVNPEVDLFEFSSRFYGEKSFRRKEQTVRGTVKGLKTAFLVQLSETEDRLDPPYYLFRSQASTMLKTLEPLGDRVEEVKDRLRIITEDDKDREFSYASVSSDGSVTLDEIKRGEDFAPGYNPKKVSAEDFIYNPMRINIGSIGLVPKTEEEVITSPDYVVFRAKGINPNYLLNVLRSPFYRMYIDVISTGSIRDRLYFDDLRKLRVPDISKAEQSLVAEFSRRVDEQGRILLAEMKSQRARVTDRLHDLLREAGGVSDQVPVEEAFRLLAEKWKRDTAIVSSLSKKVRHPSYREIIALGRQAVPLILAELSRRPDHWFAALEEITGENPVDPSVETDVSKAVQAWMVWGNLNGFGVDG